MAKSILILIVVLLVVVPVRAQEAAPDVIGWLSIPSIDLVKPIGYEPIINADYDLTDLGDGVAHLEGTTWITDNWGRVVIAGHNPGAFSRIGEIALDDLIEVHAVIEHRLVSVVYKVTGVYPGIDPSDTSWLMPTDDPRLVLVACWDNEATRIIIEAVKV